mgnify:FL=1|tara:strand:+ start:49060 stop:50466 length:1407 start_codon:yes stop_codon:yes gene_type:complete
MAAHLRRYNPDVDQPDAQPVNEPDDHPNAPRGWSPETRVTGEVQVPTSKSIAQRVLVLGAQCEGVARYAALPDSADVADLLACMQVLQVDADEGLPGVVTIQGRPPLPPDGLGGTGNDDALVLNVGESATAARILTAAVGMGGRIGQLFRIEGRGSLERRRSLPLMRALGRAIEEAGDGGWPVLVRGTQAPLELTLTDPCSSQEVSALLMALAAQPGERHLNVTGPVPSGSYVDLTLDALSTFGVQVSSETTDQGMRFTIGGPLIAPLDALRIEPDASAAAVALAAGCLSGGTVRIDGLGADSHQGDLRIVEHLQALGCDAFADSQFLEASGAPSATVDLDLTDTPDLAPPLAVLCAAATRAGAEICRLRGLGTLPGKESSRIEVLARGLTTLGWEVAADADSLTIRAGEARLDPVVLETHGDHRMVFALSLLGLLQEGVRVSQPEAVAKSWPGYWDDLAAAGARALT